MIKIRSGQERGHANLGWLDSHHTFSFGSYYDPANMGFHDLRVINEDRVMPSGGFPTHPHQDMEIITYVIEGALEHKDSMGNGSIIHKGDIQGMSAGTGVAHSEFNHSSVSPVHFLQIWILTEEKGIHPGYEQKRFIDHAIPNQLNLIAAKGGRANAIHINQDVEIYSAIFETSGNFDWQPDPARHTWIQLVNGELNVNGNILSSGDGAAISDESLVELKASKDSEFLLFNLK
ncbi:MAG: pirin family protein [Arenicellales bacterium]